jgi:RNA polymerase sigma-54 factor
MHESTVSRVTRSKLLQTPWGIFQMKDFFSSSLGDTDQEAHAAKTVRNILKEIIKNEKDSKPYSDEEISKVFKDKGINVARRTVAKYREMLNIPSSAERKRLMRLNKVINIEK